MKIRNDGMLRACVPAGAVALLAACASTHVVRRAGGDDLRPVRVSVPKPGRAVTVSPMARLIVAFPAAPATTVVPEPITTI